MAMDTRNVSTLLRTLLLGGAAFGSLTYGAAMAQTPAAPAAPAAAADADADDEVVVVGSRPLAESEAASLLIQKQADSVVSVLSADAIGRLPDQNIAFAIGRLPGISIERDQGQARYVNLRGSPVYWTTLSFDGLSVVSPEGRATRFDNIPSALAKQVIVTKAITPDLPADTVAGNVNIITRSANDYKGFTLFGNAALGYVTLGGGEEFDSSLVVANKFLDGKLGVLLQGSFYKRNMVTDNWETDPYVSQTAADVTNNVRFAREYENKPYRLTRANQSISFRTDYEISEDHKVFFSSIWTQYADEELRNNYIFRFDQGFNSANQATGVRGTGGVAGNTPLSGTVFGVQMRPNTNSLESEEETYINTFGGESTFGGWSVDWRANYTYSSDGVDAPALPDFRSPAAATSRPTVEYDFTNGDNNTVRLFRTLSTTVGGVTTLSRGDRVNSIDDFQWPLRLISRRAGEDFTQAWTFKADAEREVELFGASTEIKAGLLYVDRSKKSTQEFWTTGDLTSAANIATLNAFRAAGYDPATFYNLIRNGKVYQGEYPLGYSFTYHSKSALDAIAADLIGRGIMQRDRVTESDGYYDVNERTIGGYGMAKVDLGWGNIVFGARVEQTKNSSKAAPLIGGVRTLTTIDSEETLVYPSANLNWDITDEWKLRVGLTSTAARPDFDDLRPNFTINDTLQTISGGNPEAKPEKQRGIDAYIEYYPTGDGFFSAGLFYKDISDVLFTQRSAFGSTALNSGGIDRSGYDFTRVANAGDGYLLGGEIFISQTAQGLVDKNNLPEWLGGFGFRASGTWVDSEVNIPRVVNQRSGLELNPARTAKLLGTSDSTYNFQLTYEKYDLSIRLAYQTRTAWGQAYGTYVTQAGQIVPGTSTIVTNAQGVSSVAVSNVDSANGDTYWDADDELDLSIRYRLNERLEWYFDGVNLLDGAGRRYVNTSNYPIEYETFGERFIMGVRFNF